MQYSPEEYREILNIFKAESEEIIQSLNDGFLELEKNPEDKSPLKKLFQNAHSIKGAARMLGFNGIQDIAHKLEDILSFWKNDGVKIDSTSFSVIYEVCDFLLEAVSKSVEKQSDYFDVNIVRFLNSLDSFIKRTNEDIERKNSAEVDVFSNLTDVNAILLELMFVLEKDDKHDNFDDILMVVADNLTQLYDIFEKTGFEKIKEQIRNIKNNFEVYKESFENFDKLKNDISLLQNEIYQDLNVSVTSVKNNQNDKKEKIPKEPDKKNDIEEKYDFLLKNLIKIKKDKKFIAEIKNNLDWIDKESDNEKVKHLLSQLINILELFQLKDKIVDNDCYFSILQGISIAKQISFEKFDVNSSVLSSLLQRLNVVKDLLSLEPQKNAKKFLQTIKQNKDVISSITDFDVIKKNLSSFEMQEIKTLRVDTFKIDNLISQTGELLINGIKNREHLSEISNINMKLIQWNSESKKIINYLKYLEKRGFFNSESDDASVVFYKKIQNFLLGNTDTILELQNDFGQLYNTISEDDNKLHQTVMEIENIAKGIRILPLATIFHSFPRMIRDIAIENNKKIDFIVTGSDTTVDKKLIEEIKMPLIHILRNAVSHGIETPEDRLQNGKNETGIVKLSAKQEDNNVIITIEDDGYGINLEKVKKIAVTKGLLLEEETENLSDEQLMKILFLPGFSTNESINEISGRGIGLDIVKTKINNLNGDIQLDSVLNKGCKVTIKLPLAMSTLKTFIILINNQKYAMPVSSIKFVKKISKNEIYVRNGMSYIIYDEHSVPIFYISDIFEEKSEISINDELTIIIVENQDQQVAFIIDKLLGDQEVFHKKLVPPIIKIKNISGFTTLSTGEVCLIINPYELIRNTLMYRHNSLIGLKSAEDEIDESLYKDKKILIYNDGDINFVQNDLSSDFENVEIFDNIYVLYDYVQKNDADVLICKLDSENNDLLKFLQYLKNEEGLNKIKIVLLSDLTSLDVLKTLKHFKPDIFIKLNEYVKEMFINKLKKIFVK